MNLGPQPMTHEDRLQLANEIAIGIYGSLARNTDTAYSDIEMKIIRGIPEHASILTEIAVSAKRHWNYPEEWIQHWIPQLTISAEYISSNEVWMMTDEEKPIAFYTLSQNEEGLWLDNLWVLPEYIGQGIGKTLFEHALERCKIKKISVLKIEADPNAQRFYEKMGAKQVSEHFTQVNGQARRLPVMEMLLNIKKHLPS